MKVFWRISLLEESYERGAYLTNTLFVKKEMWRRKGAKIAMVKEKMEIFRKMKSGFKTLSSIKRQDAFSRPDKREVDHLIEEIRRTYSK